MRLAAVAEEGGRAGAFTASVGARGVGYIVRFAIAHANVG